jgi:hypothetical protein
VVPNLPDERVVPVLPPLAKALKRGDLEVERDLDIIDPGWRRLPGFKEDFGTCRFCGTGLDRSSEPFVLGMHKRDDANRIERASLRIPRCLECRSHQSKARAATTVGSIVGLLAFMAGTTKACIGSFEGESSFLGFLGLVLWFAAAPISFLAGGVLGNLISRLFLSTQNAQAILTTRFGIKIGKSPVAWEAHPSFQKLKRKGWEIGSGA